MSKTARARAGPRAGADGRQRHTEIRDMGVVVLNSQDTFRQKKRIGASLWHSSARSCVTYLRVRALGHLLLQLRRRLAARRRTVPPGQREPGLHIGQTEARGAEVATERGCIRGALGGGGGGELAQPGRRLAERARGAEGERDEREGAARRTWLGSGLELGLEFGFTAWRGSRWRGEGDAHPHRVHRQRGQF